MSTPQLCLQCAAGSIASSKISGSNTADWVRRAGRSDPVPTRFARPSKVRATKANPAADLEIQFTMSPLLAKVPVLWWAAMPLPLPLAADHSSAAEAYDIANDIPNAGVVRVGKNGSVTIRLMTPQPYVEDGRQWPRHAHFVLPRTDGVDAWDKSCVFTIAAWPGSHDSVTVKKLLPAMQLGMHEMRGFVSPRVVRACWSLPMARVCAIEAVDIIRVGGYALDPRLDLQLAYDAPDEEVHQLARRLASLGVPAVVYCASTRCPAAAILMKRILSTGLFANLFYMDEGIDGFVRDA